MQRDLRDNPPERPADKIDIDKIDSAALKRLVAEVQDDRPEKSTGYNRTYHRHNRS